MIDVNIRLRSDGDLHVEGPTLYSNFVDVSIFGDATEHVTFYIRDTGKARAIAAALTAAADLLDKQRDSESSGVLANLTEPEGER